MLLQSAVQQPVFLRDVHAEAAQAGVHLLRYPGLLVPTEAVGVLTQLLTPESDYVDIPEATAGLRARTETAF